MTGPATHRPGVTFHDHRSSWWWSAALGGVLVVLLTPVTTVLVTADGRDAVARLLGGGALVLRNTLVMATLVAVCGTLLAWACAHAHQHAFRGRRLVHLLCLTPLLLPPPTIALALLVLVGHNGIVNRQWAPGGEIYGLPGLVISSTLSAFPFAYLIVLHSLNARDLRVSESAADLGASRGRVLVDVELRELRPTLAVSFLVLFAEAVTDLADPLVIGGGYTVLSTRLFEAATAENDVADAIAHAAALVVPWLFIAVAVHRLGGSPRPALRRQIAPVRRPARGWSRLSVTVQVVVAAAITSASAVVVSASVGLIGDDGPTLEHVAAVLTGPWQNALADTVFLGLCATLCTLPLGFCLGWHLAERPTSLPARLTVALHALPPLVCGLAAWVAITRWSVPVAAALPAGVPVGEALTWIALLVVAVTASLPGNALAVSERLRRLPPSYVEAAHVLGARRRDVVRDVVLPQARPVLLGEIPTTLARSLSALAPAALLATARTPLLPVDLVTAAEAGRLSSACAMAVVLGVLVGSAAWSTAPARPSAPAPAGARPSAATAPSLPRRTCP
ncbi:iron(III) transport system permease protein [Austwickia chelonae]|uniref:Putative ABC transporter permease protein n=1 Tax=Austwickia chelonae NBRC 105200 TaxID=1184607 RepID=K6VUV7_9MICO|nr:ABC transporter permease subunit [Austwickia chelonae]GAB79110.1 putative ABC transporter permease protein [Austwickia chelonae NBRC 105200]SEW42335.1 iron(III) transport system permease protein [Austwickia chelonae]